MKLLFVPPVNASTRASLGLLVLRLGLGIAFLVHGSGKIAAPFAWMPPEAPVPGVLQALAAVSEFGGGLLLILGLLTPLAALSLVGTMAVATFFHMSKGDGFVQGYELAIEYLAVALGLLLAGPGKFSLDAVLAKKRGA